MADVDGELPGMKMNVTAPRFAVGRSTAVCEQCGSVTPVFALALLAAHRVLMTDDDECEDGEAHPGDPAEATSTDIWQTASGNALLFHMDEIGAAAASQLGRLAPTLRPDADVRVAGWVNHCGHCHAMLHDHDLFCEPGGAFMPISAEAARRIQFVTIESCFQAAAGGYAYEPAFMVFPD